MFMNINAQFILHMILILIEVSIGAPCIFPFSFSGKMLIGTKKIHQNQSKNLFNSKSVDSVYAQIKKFVQLMQNALMYSYYIKTKCYNKRSLLDTEIFVYLYQT